MTSAPRMFSPPVMSLVALAPRSVGVARLADCRALTFLLMAEGSLGRRSYLRLNAGANRALDPEDAVLAEAPAVGVDDRLHLRPVRERIEHHDDQELGALALDAAVGHEVLAAHVEHAEAIGKERRHRVVEEGRPFRLA